MSKAFIAAVIQDSLGCTEVAAKRAANALLAGIVGELRREGGFTLPNFGAFTVREIKAQPRVNPATGAPVAGRSHRTVRFKVSPALRKSV